MKPYTEDKLHELARRGVQRVFVAMPGFTADCLETIDEIGYEAREAFRHAGGKELHPCPCLNDHPAWIEAMATIDPRGRPGVDVMGIFNFPRSQAPPGNALPARLCLAA